MWCFFVLQGRQGEGGIALRIRCKRQDYERRHKKDERNLRKADLPRREPMQFSRCRRQSLWGCLKHHDEVRFFERARTIAYEMTDEIQKSRSKRLRRTSLPSIKSFSSDVVRLNCLYVCLTGVRDRTSDSGVDVPDRKCDMARERAILAR